MGRTDQVVYELAAAQDRVCTRAQLEERGVSNAAIGRRRRSGVLWPIRPGVFAVGGPPGPGQLLAAALLVLPHSAASHATAAVAHGFAVHGMGGLHVTALRGGTHDLPGVVVHETRHLPAADVSTVDGRRVTSPARTIADLATVLRPAALRHLVERQLTEGRPGADELVACHRALARRGRPGTTRLRAVLDLVLDDEPFPESVLELALLQLLVDEGIGGVARQFRPPWYDGRRGTVDVAHEASRTIIEADGRRWHATSQAFDDDRRRDRLAVTHGWRVLRFGWQEVTTRPAVVAAEIRTVLGLPARAHAA